MQLNGIPPAPQPYRTSQMHQLQMQMQMAPPTSSFVGMPPMQPQVQPMFREFPLPAMQQFSRGMPQQSVMQPPGLPAPSPLDALAREFGVDASLIEALAQRLSGMR
jgi:soluble lytic murein transglycosylase-like protein